MTCPTFGGTSLLMATPDPPGWTNPLSPGTSAENCPPATDVPRVCHETTRWRALRLRWRLTACASNPAPVFLISSFLPGGAFQRDPPLVDPCPVTLPGHSTLPPLP